MKFTPLTGVVIAVMVLGILAGVLAQVNVVVNEADLSGWGIYGGYIKNFMNSTPVIMFITLIYNVFMFAVRTQEAKLKKVTELYDTTKLVSTACAFVAVIGPVFALAPSAEWRAIGSLITFTILTVGRELINVWETHNPQRLITP